MKSKSIESYVSEAQNTACTIISLTEILSSKIDHLWSYSDMPYDGCKEELFALTDSIKHLASHINLEGVNV